MQYPTFVKTLLLNEIDFFYIVYYNTILNDGSMI